MDNRWKDVEWQKCLFCGNSLPDQKTEARDHLVACAEKYRESGPDVADVDQLELGCGITASNK